jgi:hypothetical protein
VIVYWLVPYLVATAPAVIVLLAILVGGCTMTRTADDPFDRASYYSDPNGRSSEQLTRELDRRATREELRRIVEEGAR